MNKIKYNFIYYITIIVLLISLFMIFPAINLYAHGADGHDENAFTNYDAVKKSLKLFDKLLIKNNLVRGWESDFSEIIVLRPMKEKDNIVVKISRQKGKPGTLFIFFDKDGKYRGSNFKGR
jgi:hypothetical protein